ncbi:MAG: HAD family hydrolase [Coriobacteriia bacterium]|nr:HAD family hydrolase [Coriobacteriia bacterium]
MSVRALVFDFDGLIIASETNAVRSWQDLYARFGHELPLEKWATLIGTWDAEWDPGAELAERVGNGHDWEAIERERRAAELAGAHQLQALPGVIDRLDDARRLGLPLAIASSSDRAWVVGHLTRLGIADRFEAVITRDDVTRTKPDPELYTRAVAALGMTPEHVVALEDSLHGVVAAKAAGMRCVAVPNPLLAHEDYSAADICVPSLADSTLEALLARLG